MFSKKAFKNLLGFLKLILLLSQDGGYYVMQHLQHYPMMLFMSTESKKTFPNAKTIILFPDYWKIIVMNMI